MDISRSMAQEIIDELGGILNQQLNFFDARGYILASAHPERVGSYHAGAARLIREGLDELIVYRDDEYEGARKGCNLPLVMDTAVVGAIGITGEYEQVRKYGQIIKKMTEILLRESDEQQRRKIESRIRTRFLDDWIMTDQHLNDPAFLQRARAQEIDITLSRRVAALRIADITRYADSSPGQETIDSINRWVRQALSQVPGAIFSKTASVMILLLPAQDDERMLRFVNRLMQGVMDRFKVRLLAGVDSGADIGHAGVHQAWKKAMKALQACAAQKERQVLFYDDITYELFLDDISSAAKALFVQRVFGGIPEEEIAEYAGLVKTLYQMDGSISRAADAHFIHKNTLQYKLNKLTRITGRDPRSYKCVPLYSLAILFMREQQEE